jgi:uncharacterized protein YjiS (DUF1127 family)
MFKKLIKAIQENQTRRATYYLLHSLSDKALKDIGITRGEINQKIFDKHS